MGDLQYPYNKIMILSNKNDISFFTETFFLQ